MADDAGAEDGRPVTAASPFPAHVERAAATLALLAAPTRLWLVWLLCHGERDVTALAEVTGTTVPAVSQHLAKLRLAGLVRAHREGRHQVYAVDDPHVVLLVEQIVEHAAPDSTPEVTPAGGRGGRARPRRAGRGLPRLRRR